MNHEDHDPMDPEIAALLAHAAPERRPPASMKGRVMASLREDARPAISIRRWAMPAFAAATAVAILIVYLMPRSAERITLVFSVGDVALDGRLAADGSGVSYGQEISVSGDGEAIVRIGSAGGFKLSRGGRARVLSHDNGVEVVVDSGWLLNSVRTGARYSVKTPRSRVAALGTDFIVKVREGRAYVCICHGRISLSGDFPEPELASENHDALAEPAFPPDGAVGMQGHSDADIAELRGKIGLPP